MLCCAGEENDAAVAQSDITLTAFRTRLDVGSSAQSAPTARWEGDASSPLLRFLTVSIRVFQRRGCMSRVWSKVGSFSQLGVQVRYAA